MDLNRPIDIYCERIDPGFWAEPVNALSNVAFIIAALWAWRLALRSGAGDGAINVLLVMTALVGVGSFLFHTFGTVWAALADVVPIGLLALSYLYVALRRFFALSAGRAIAGTAGFAVAVGIFVGGVASAGPSTIPSFNGSLFYAPFFVALLVLAGVLGKQRHTAWSPIAAASALFALSLFFRSVDMSTCTAIPLGTHFLWHVLNGVVLALLLKAVVDAGPRNIRN